ncbi:hypothetical protein BJ742DRAFT_824729 [Cladochytrium replicatum]|nr:hypothetical protein BJ742DRAFT_824729 [Cladochytrium replicatum]
MDMALDDVIRAQRPSHAGPVRSRGRGRRDNGPYSRPGAKRNLDGQWKHDLHQGPASKNSVKITVQGNTRRIESGVAEMAGRVATSSFRGAAGGVSASSGTRAGAGETPASSASATAAATPGALRLASVAMNMLKGVPATSSSGPVTLVISNLHESASEADIETVFHRFGSVLSCTLRYDTDGNSTGVAEVIFERRRDATKAIEELHNKIVDGRLLQIVETASIVGASMNPTAPKGEIKGRGISTAGAVGGGLYADRIPQPPVVPVRSSAATATSAPSALRPNSNGPIVQFSGINGNRGGMAAGNSEPRFQVTFNTRRR